jgi:hypothetical protein
MPLEAGFGEVEAELNAAEDFVVVSAKASDEIVVFFVRPDPEPDNEVAGSSRQGAVRRSEPH